MMLKRIRRPRRFVCHAGSAWQVHLESPSAKDQTRSFKHRVTNAEKIPGIFILGIRTQVERERREVSRYCACGLGVDATTTRSTRRFSLRPSAVALSAMG